MSTAAPDEPIAAGLERLVKFQAAQREVAAEVARERAEQAATQQPVVPAEQPAPEQERG